MKLIFGIILLLAVCIGTAIWARYHGWFQSGNHRRYDPRYVAVNPDSPLRGKTMLCLGSSVSKGMTSFGLSFVDYLNRIDGCTMIKEAISASFIADRGRRSFLRRLKRHPARKQHLDLFLCQLSTNDANFGSRLGQVCDSFEQQDFNVKTTVGALEYIISFAQDTWNCPIVILTGTKYDNPRYHYLVNQVLELQEKWGVALIDLWHDKEMNEISPEQYKFYMCDGVHPTKAGYLEWWTPKIQKHLYEIMTPTGLGKAAPPDTGHSKTDSSIFAM